jgi:DoxX-like protein
MFAPAPRWMTLVGHGLTWLCALFLFMDAGMKLLQLPIVLETTMQLGWPASSVVPLGVVLLISTLLYVFPRTSILGAVLLTGYLGGAVATHARIGSPLFTHTLFGVYIGVVMWAELYLRDSALRSFFPARWWPLAEDKSRA